MPRDRLLFIGKKLAEKIEHIGKRDIVWSYASTIFTIGAGVILLPFILNQMSSETVGIWNIFQTITALVMLLDFGFRPSFARNISYIFSGIKQLKVHGVAALDEGNSDVDYSLLKGTLQAMQRFYRWLALAMFILLATAGSVYFYFILQKYTGDHKDAMIAWVLLITINCYNLYTLYYDALLLGKGYIKKNQQITILAQIIYLSIAVGLIYSGLGLVAIVGAQLVATIIRRVLSYRVFFTKEIKQRLQEVEAYDSKDIFRTILPNAVKVGLTHLGGFMVNKSALLIGSAFLSLEQIACYGITLQVMDVLARCGTVVHQTFTPKLAQCRAKKDLRQLKRYYQYAVFSNLAVYVVGGIVWVIAGNRALDIINSNTTFVPTVMLCTMLIISLLEHNHSISAGFIMADNKIPFFIPSLVSGAATILLLWLFLSPLQLGLWGMILAPGIAQLVYQNWKWPSVVIKELRSAK